MPFPVSEQLVIIIFRFQHLALGYFFNNNTYFRKVLILFLDPFVVFLKLGRVMRVQLSSSLNNSSTESTLWTFFPVSASLSVLAVTSLGIFISKGIPLCKVICERYIEIASDIDIFQTSLHQKTLISKIHWEYSCFRQKNVLSDHNWTLLIFWPIVISDSYPLNRAIEHYLRRRNVHFLALKMGGNNEV